jgi:hypothetical protein
MIDVKYYFPLTKYYLFYGLKPFESKKLKKGFVVCLQLQKFKIENIYNRSFLSKKTNRHT